MVRINSISPIFVFAIVALLEAINGITTGDNLCLAKYESQYEDACMRGYRMKTLADGRSSETLSGVTCSDSCVDTYKDNTKLIEPCKFGCGVRQSVTTGDETLPFSNIFNQMHQRMLNMLPNILKLFNGAQSLAALPSDTTTSDDKSQSPEEHSRVSVKRVRIIVPFGHPEQATVQRSSQEFDGGSDPLAFMQRIMSGPPSEETVAKVNVMQEKPAGHIVMHNLGEENSEGYNSWMPRLRFIIRTPQETEDKTGASFGERFSCLLNRINPVFTFLTFLLILSIVILVVQLIVSCCRRRRRSQNHEYTALPTYFEDHYPDNFEVKQKGADNFDMVKSKEAMGV